MEGQLVTAVPQRSIACGLIREELMTIEIPSRSTITGMALIH